MYCDVYHFFKLILSLMLEILNFICFRFGLWRLQNVLVVDFMLWFLHNSWGVCEFLRITSEFLFLTMFDVKSYFHLVLLSRASEISGVLICVVIALRISGDLFDASCDFVKFLCLGVAFSCAVGDVYFRVNRESVVSLCLSSGCPQRYTQVYYCAAALRPNPPPSPRPTAGPSRGGPSSWAACMMPAARRPRTKSLALYRAAAGAAVRR